MSNAFPTWTPGGSYRINTITELNPLVLSDIRAFLEQDPPRIPIKQISGFTGWQAYSAFVNAEQEATSTTYQSLGGPTLQNLPPGQYVLWYGATTQQGSGAAGIKGAMAPSVNGASPATGSECIVTVLPTGTITDANASMASTATLTSDGGNTIEILYLTNSAGNGIKFRNRWLTALRYA